ncbi:MAG TPA: tyrosine-type recombinase/integrase, partial [bacterium]|nr:tyrosine-type recombinase/integrase [bacterium]
MSYTTPFQWLKRVIRKYNRDIKNNQDIPGKEKEQLYLPEIPFHGLRHTSATLLISEKVDVKTISSRLGHTLSILKNISQKTPCSSQIK